MELIGMIYLINYLNMFFFENKVFMKKMKI